MTITFEQMKLCLQQQQQQFLASQEQMLESLMSKIAIQSRITPEEKGIELSLIHSFTGTCYLTNRHDLDLIGIDWIDKLNLWKVPLDAVCTLKDPHVPKNLPVSNVTSNNNVLTTAHL
ncbi:Gag-Pol polyprotein, partial [Schistosoma japonicum]